MPHFLALIKFDVTFMRFVSKKPLSAAFSQIALFYSQLFLAVTRFLAALTTLFAVFVTAFFATTAFFETTLVVDLPLCLLNSSTRFINV